MEAVDPRGLDPSLGYFVEIAPFGPDQVDFTLLLGFQGGVVAVSWGFLGPVAYGVLLGPLGGLGPLYGLDGRLLLGLLKTGVPTVDSQVDFAHYLVIFLDGGYPRGLGGLVVCKGGG